MASKFLHEAQRGASRGSIDLPLALLAGLAVGFVAFVMPQDLVARAVEISGLPSVLPAAAPPLGTKAQGLLAAAAAGATVAAVLLLLRMLGGKAEPVRARDFDEPDYEPPRLRRSDVHPDAPSRRPILAARELGEPSTATPASVSPAPFWRPEDFPADPEPEPEPGRADEQDDPLDALDLNGPGIEMLEPVAAESAPAEAAADRPLEPEPEPPQPPPAEPAEPVDGASIAELMARLERGLARRLQQQDAGAPPPPRSPAPPPPAHGFAAVDGGDDRLRSAIENLQRMAARAR